MRLGYNIRASKRVPWQKRRPHQNCADRAMKITKELA